MPWLYCLFHCDRKQDANLKRKLLVLWILQTLRLAQQSGRKIFIFWRRTDILHSSSCLWLQNLFFDFVLVKNRKIYFSSHYSHNWKLCSDQFKNTDLKIQGYFKLQTEAFLNIYACIFCESFELNIFFRVIIIFFKFKWRRSWHKLDLQMWWS